jgi:hypothetical protein
VSHPATRRHRLRSPQLVTEPGPANDVNPEWTAAQWLAGSETGGCQGDVPSRQKATVASTSASCAWISLRHSSDGESQ